KTFPGHLVAVNVPPQESFTDYFAYPEVKSSLGFANTYEVNDPGRLAEVRTRLKLGTPLWGLLLILALIVLAVETFVGNDVLRRIVSGRKAEAAELGPLSKNAITSLRRRREKRASDG
ncbi:MAG: hypothetical protein WC712_12655, partial [Candidatus Brocadiia bacterium]